MTSDKNERKKSYFLFFSTAFFSSFRARERTKCMLAPFQREKRWKMGRETIHHSAECTHNAEIFISHKKYVCDINIYKYSEKEWKNDSGDDDGGGGSKRRRTMKNIVQFRKFYYYYWMCSVRKKYNFICIYFPFENFCAWRSSRCVQSTQLDLRRSVLLVNNTLNTLAPLVLYSLFYLLVYCHWIDGIRILKVANFPCPESNSQIQTARRHVHPVTPYRRNP